jgi:hypothetical protein
MGVVVNTTGREYGHALLGAGGFTAVSRWTRDPKPGVAEHQEPIPEELAAALYRLASSAALPLSSLLLAVAAPHVEARSAGRGLRHLHIRACAS